MQYLAPSVLQAGIKSGQLFQGHFNPNPYNYKEVSSPKKNDTSLGRVSLNLLFKQATVAVHGRDKPILIVGLESMNRSVAGDVVVVELLPESQWQGAGDDVVDSDGESPLSHNLLDSQF